MKTKFKEEVTQLSQRFFNGRQSVEFEGIYKITTHCVGKIIDHKVKVIIDVDSYDFQSSAQVRVFNPDTLEWNGLGSIPYSNMESVGNVFSGRGVGSEDGEGLNRSEFSAIMKDVERLLEQAKLILL